MQFSAQAPTQVVKLPQLRSNKLPQLKSKRLVGM